jgi:MraZ protein
VSEGYQANYFDFGLSLMGDKDRFVLPAPLRKEVIKSSGEEKTLLLKKHQKWPCLIGFGRSHFISEEKAIARDQQLANDRGEYFDIDLANMQRIGGSKSVSFDASGRFALPSAMRKLGKIDYSIFFYGVGRTFTLWNPSILMEQDDSWEEAKIHCEDCLEGLGRK